MIEKTTDIEYVYVEMTPIQSNDKTNKYEVFSGLFQGIKTHKDAIYVVLHGKEKVINVVNLAYYDLMTIEVRYKYYKNMTHLTAKDKDQKLALSSLDSLYKDLLKNGFGQSEDEDLISILKYTNVPKEYYTQLTSPYIKKSGICEVGQFSNSNIINHSNYQSKTEITPSLFNRTGTKKPSKEQLVLMQKKLDQISKGEFKCNIPEIFGPTKSVNSYDNSQFWMA